MKRFLAALAACLLPGFLLWLSLWILNSVILAFLLYYCLACLLVPLGAAILERKGIRGTPESLGLARPRGSDLLWGLGSGLVTDALMVAAFAILGGLLMGDNRIVESLEAWGLSRRNIALVYVVMVLFNGAVEEIYWRGFVHRLFRGMGNRPLALALPTLAFGLQHVFVISSIMPGALATALAIAGITAGGALWALLREWRGSLWPALVSHVLVTIGYLGIFSYYIFNG